MNNKFEIKNVLIQGKTIKYEYVITGEWKKYFSDISFKMKYSHKVENVPKSMAVIPLLCNVLPIAWLSDATILVDELDEQFYKSIPGIKKGYQEMYPNKQFKGQINCKEIKGNSNTKNNDMSAASFFSGGVDAFHTLFRHLSDIKYLITVRGSDVKLSDTDGWNNVKLHVEKTCRDFGLNSIVISSNFRNFIRENELDKLVKDTEEMWWHGFQHGIGLLGLAAPSAYVFQLSHIFIASSFSEDMKGKYTCASDPTIDNQLHYGKTYIMHDGYECSRQRKVKEICSITCQTEKRPVLRVCWQENAGKNCCRCEKCYRTMMEIISEGYDPNDFGFQWDDIAKKQCEKALKREIIMPQMYVDAWWRDIQITMQNKKEKFSEYQWFMDMDLTHFNDNWHKKVRHLKIIRIGKRFCHIIKRDRHSV